LVDIMKKILLLVIGIILISGLVVGAIVDNTTNHIKTDEADAKNIIDTTPNSSITINSIKINQIYGDIKNDFFVVDYIANLSINIPIQHFKIVEWRIILPKTVIDNNSYIENQTLESLKFLIEEMKVDIQPNPNVVYKSHLSNNKELIK